MEREERNGLLSVRETKWMKSNVELNCSYADCRAVSDLFRQVRSGSGVVPVLSDSLCC